MSVCLSVIIITKNAEKDIERCLQSINFANEIIILDSGSQDATRSICQKYTPHVYLTDWPGFGIQKNRALCKTSQEWVLSLDADEWLSNECIQEICDILRNPRYDAYEFPRLSSFLGRWIHYGDWRNDRVIRLFKRCKGKFSEVQVHEKLCIEGNIGTMIHPILHEPYKTLEEVINKANLYSSASAVDFAERKQGGLLKALVHGFWRFFRGYVIKKGFLDGREGFILAVANAENSYYRYLKISECNSKKTTISNHVNQE